MSLPYFSIQAGRSLSRVLAYEIDALYCREGVTILAGDGADRTLDIGTVIGRRLFGAPTSARTGTGTGTLTLDATTPLLSGAKVGTYTVTCIAAAANGGTFRVTDPDGHVLGDVAVGGTFASAVKFTIADGATDFIVGDSFTVTVPEGDLKAVAIDFDALDGTQIAAGVMASCTTAPDGIDADGSAVVRGALVNEAQLLWPDGATTPQKAAALAQLKSAGILPRKEA